MKTSKNILSAAMALVLLTGCSSQPAAPAQTETDTVAASNVLRVGMECNYAPFNWTTTTQTDMTVQISGVDYADGYDVQIARKLADDLGMELQIVKLDWDSLILSLQKDQIDAVIAGMTVTDERKKNVDFTESYAKAVQVVIVKEDSDIKSIDDISSKNKIGVQQGTTGDIYASDTVENGGYGEDAVTKYNSGPDAVQALLSDKVDCVIIDNEPAKAYVAANQGLKILDSSFADEEYAICVKKGNSQLKNDINKALKELKDDGTIDKIVSKYIK